MSNTSNHSTDMAASRRDSVADSTRLKSSASNDYKSKLKPRTVWDRPEIAEVFSGGVKLKWKESSLPQYAVQTDIWYIVEQRESTCMDWTKVSVLRDLQSCYSSNERSDYDQII